MAADKNGDIWFEDVRVPSWYRAHGPGKDAEAFYQLISFGQVMSIAFLTGAMLNLYERLYEFRVHAHLQEPSAQGKRRHRRHFGRIAGDIDICRILGYEARHDRRPQEQAIWQPLVSEDLVGKDP